MEQQNWKWKQVTRKEIEEGYEGLIGEEYSKLPKRDKELLYQRYRLIESTTEEYYKEKQREMKG
jgi:hypothetical protein